jgi:hypothetical protein
MHIYAPSAFVIFWLSISGTLPFAASVAVRFGGLSRKRLESWNSQRNIHAVDHFQIVQSWNRSFVRRLKRTRSLPDSAFERVGDLRCCPSRACSGENIPYEEL